MADKLQHSAEENVAWTRLVPLLTELGNVSLGPVATNMSPLTGLALAATKMLPLNGAVSS
jgi:hypothetical protein